MHSQETNKPSVRKTFQKAFHLFKTSPILLIPFVTFTIIESFALIIIFFSPRKPFLFVLGPLISKIWGERYLHYPYNFLLLPKLIAFSKMGLVIVFDSLLIGMAVFMFQDAFNKKPIRTVVSLMSALKKYLYLSTIVLIFTVLFYLIIRTMNGGLFYYFATIRHKFSNPNAKIWLAPVLLSLNFLVAVFIQASFIYSIPLLIIEKHNFLKAIFKSFALFKKLFIYTILLVGLPMLIYTPIIVLNYNTVFLIKKFSPELIPIISFIGIFITTIIIDPLITISATLTVLETRKN
jgi:hypothetical protein